MYIEYIPGGPGRQVVTVTARRVAPAHLPGNGMNWNAMWRGRSSVSDPIHGSIGGTRSSTGARQPIYDCSHGQDGRRDVHPGEIPAAELLNCCES
jgi:hypothetical protein